MKVGETYRLRLAWATPKSYSSNLASIASVNKKGIVTAKKSGVATITVKDTLNRKIDMKIVVQKKGTKKIAPTALQKKRMHNSQYVSYDKLVKNNHYDKTIITDNIVKKTKLKSIDNKKLPMLSGVIMENRGQINNYRADIDVNDVYSGGLTSDYVTEEEINFQAVNGMNCIRLMYSLSYLSKGSNVDQINVTELQVLDEIVSWCMKNNVSLMLSYSEVPGHDVKHAKNIFYDNSWLSDPQTSETVKRYMALIAQRWHGAQMIHFHLQRSLPMEVLQ
ncbi:MAG: cellulase family glycosylhydrolase [Lachnobacterium sp.]|nr:cellulase family glycosylhydrolase [Lachnobacterium sp.]